MGKDLIIVESPAKVKTISKFLGKNYRVAASVGHVRDLPRQNLGVDEEKGFEPQYEVISGKEDVVKKLRSAASKADTVYLAPDPDREGEAIAWHVAELIKDKVENISRIQFNEITARAVKDALEHPRPLNEELFDSQQARRILDRLVGYKISPILWKKVKRGISAGRVQSVALKIVVEREKERRAFEPEEYWVFKVDLASGEEVFTADLWKVDGKTRRIGSAEEAQALEKAMDGQPYVVSAVDQKERARQPKPPFITSTLQQDANRFLGFTAKRTMSVAQRLYEGLELGELGTTALITYMRTDSVRIAKEARDSAKELILKNFGKDYYPAKPRVYKTKGSAQDAHEAIRPVDPALTPDVVGPHLAPEQLRLYTLIWNRFMASQMAPAKIWDTKVSVACGPALWRAKGERLLFPGWLKVMGKEAGLKDVELPQLAKDQVLDLKKLHKEQKFTQPPARYSEASLVKELEEKGIGRPSTYAAIISTLLDREYVNKNDSKQFVPTELGFTVSDQLSKHFTDLMDVGFTANMENLLDKVAEGKQNWTDLLQGFAKDFYPTLDKAKEEMTRGGQMTDIMCEECGKPLQVRFSRGGGEFLGCSGFPACRTIKNFERDEKGAIRVLEKKADEKTGIICEKCGLPMVVKQSRRGEFLGCSGYPECANIVNFNRGEDGSINVIDEEKPEIVGSCPQCDGNLIVKKARTGSRFIACDNYPKCDYTQPFSTGVPCPQPDCDGELVEKSSRRGKVFYSCNRYPKCRYAVWDMPVNEPCPKCEHPILTMKNTKDHGLVYACPQKGCDYMRPVDGGKDQEEGKE